MMTWRGTRLVTGSIADGERFAANAGTAGIRGGCFGLVTLSHVWGLSPATARRAVADVLRSDREFVSDV